MRHAVIQGGDGICSEGKLSNHVPSLLRNIDIRIEIFTTSFEG